jgi:hypothetical protein
MKWYLALCASLLITACEAEQAPTNDTTETKPTVILVSQESEEPRSWWDKTKDSTVNIWNKATQSVGEYIGSTPEPAPAPDPVEPDTEPTQQYGKNPYFGKIWNEVTPRINQILAIEQKQDNLPDNGWFTESKQSSQNKLNQLLDEAVEILSLSDSNQIRQHINDLEQDIVDIKNTIADYRQAQVSAPVESTWKTTVEQYDEKIVNLQDQIAQKYQQIDKLKLEFGQSLQKIGIQLTSEQLDVLFASVVGDDIIQASLVYENVKLVNQQLMELTASSGEDFTISKRYYGMYVVLLKILFHMQDSFVTDIDNKYIPKIAEIEVDVQKIKIATQNLLRKNGSTKHKEHLLANLEAQKLTLKTADLYKQHLASQRKKMLVARDKTLADLLVAENTFATVTVSSELVSLLRTSQKAFELLQNMQTPDLLIFENLQMKQEFAILTQKLNS